MKWVNVYFLGYVIFIAGVIAGKPPIAEAELVQSSLATIAVLDSLREGRRVTLEA